MKEKIDHKDYYKNLGEKLRNIREKQNLIQKEIATKLGITFQQYQKYERGENRIPTKSLVTFCEITNSDIKELTGCNVSNYEKGYKEEVVNNITNIYHNYNGFFSILFNTDFAIIKNKVAISFILASLIIWFICELFKTIPIINTDNYLLFSIQNIAFLLALAISLFVAFGYNILTYSITYIVYLSIYNIVNYKIDLAIIGFNIIIMYCTCFILTFLTFYILKQLKINLKKN